MTKAERQNALNSILANSINKRLTVISARDALISRYPGIRGNSANIRRWIAGKFTTYTRRGWLIKGQNEVTRKPYYVVQPTFYNNFPGHTYDNQTIQDQPPLPEPPSLDAIQKIAEDLDQYRRTFISQLSEIEEYKRVRSTYPELSELAVNNFNLALEENYKLLGKVKALENLMSESNRGGK